MHNWHRNRKRNRKKCGLYHWVLLGLGNFRRQGPERLGREDGVYIFIYPKGQN